MALGGKAPPLVPTITFHWPEAPAAPPGHGEESN